MSARGFLVLGLAVPAVAAVAVGASATTPAAPAGASGHAYAIKVVVPGESGAVRAEVTGPPDAVAFGGAFAYPADGSAVSAASTSASASTVVDASASASATASSEVTGLSLFGGEVTASDVSGNAKANATGRDSAGDLSGAGLSGLVVLGQPVQVAANLRVALADWGYAIVLEQAVERSAPPGGQGSSGFVTALDVHLTADHGGLPAGSEILVGYAQAAAQSSPQVETTTTVPPAPEPKQVPTFQLPQEPKAKPAPKAPEPKRRSPGLPPPVHKPPPNITPKLTAGGYVFPVYGPSSFVDTFGAPRADVTYHHGDDIFAPLGAPLLAVADGTVFSVGWNDIGGNRLWLRDHQGNEFYYAHLSAFSPLAKNGAEVHAGDVLGFVGNTGDARGTPYHLHFEVHPVSLLYLGYDGAVDPTSYLTAWQHLQDVSFKAIAGWLPPVGVKNPAPMPGAILLQVSDISSASGLDPGSLERALVAPVSAEGDGALLRSVDVSGPARPEIGPPPGAVDR